MSILVRRLEEGLPEPDDCELVEGGVGDVVGGAEDVRSGGARSGMPPEDIGKEFGDFLEEGIGSVISKVRPVVIVMRMMGMEVSVSGEAVLCVGRYLVLRSRPRTLE